MHQDSLDNFSILFIRHDPLDQFRTMGRVLLDNFSILFIPHNTLDSFVHASRSHNLLDHFCPCVTFSQSS